MMNYLEEYDEADPISIETYAKRLIGKTFADVCKQDDITKAMVVRETTNYEVKHENKKRKGGLGELIEERFFHYQTNNDARPDFDKAGVELKVTPYKQNKNGTLVAKERLILTMIDYFSVVDETFEDSHMWQKARLILLVYYLYQQEIKNRLDYRIGDHAADASGRNDAERSAACSPKIQYLCRLVLRPGMYGLCGQRRQTSRRSYVICVVYRYPADGVRHDGYLRPCL